MIRIVFTGGGTGGHIYPTVAVMEELKKRQKSNLFEYVYIGSGSSLEDPVRSIATRSYTVASGKYRRYFSFLNGRDVFRVIVGFFHSLWILFREMPDVVFAKGGYVSVPVVVAAWLYRIPIVIHESDAVPGVANKFLGKFANKVALGYGSASEYFVPDQVELTGTPVQEDALNGDRSAAYSLFNLSESKPTVLVYGGSQGSQVINECVVDILDDLLNVSQVIHQTGDNNYEVVKQMAAKHGVKPGERGYRVYPFLKSEERKAAYSVADLVVSRSGATSIAELAANGEVVILVPYASAANQHQKVNAYAVARQGGALVLEENNLTKHLLLQKIQTMLFDKELRERMMRNIRKFHAPDAAKKIADMIVSFVE